MTTLLRPLAGRLSEGHMPTGQTLENRDIPEEYKISAEQAQTKAYQDFIRRRVKVNEDVMKIIGEAMEDYIPVWKVTGDNDAWIRAKARPQRLIFDPMDCKQADRR